ncbi:hypothetical protein GJ904_17565 [Salmonella enterica]|nr:hypothetical protein [Salmonella enterica subsp. enterica serovar Saintpaul]EEC1302880.1 hypothetical protein [Salmonella enterica]
MIRWSFASGVGSDENFTLTIPAAHANIATDKTQSHPETPCANLLSAQVTHG